MLLYFIISNIVLETGQVENMIESRALNILESYSGANNYILRLKNLKNHLFAVLNQVLNFPQNFGI
jgi:hypothetical protein